ncbi:Asp-tRNA(Asn)/Glu-tRNA(Gln) amidotransferase subunit GatC [Rhodocaloribacter litoris]|uniref:Asp-tRNA(Asn)/Glu-tRNA(Gln) amidotransferase subunit GatC n=1 Tax=Rhodocaloribacter litoris TaxID=2558931 RepID=UPI00141EAE30|nr:Asp-tRNA(Asn)/Glu-tRNA(Gln) amidotransferase subunit GatC [Rhodocaloribacter litoris]QXD15243.1 Asp-tRNA(Asn)/Glu-tRNA(Gln) amidotransferase subunit GatC [Rhodocaloribacter litoris]GIV62237.1 MAG: aspartyl/glutamyl-tRNA(Asn/Gln) amidotransferase subunit C [Rhodothermaceae bacterium]
MSVSVEEVRYIARLARLRFSEEEERRLAVEMSAILDYMDQLTALDTEGVPPMSHVLDLYNVEREDRAETRITREEALRNAPDATAEFFRVPRVIE